MTTTTRTWRTSSTTMTSRLYTVQPCYRSVKRLKNFVEFGCGVSLAKLLHQMLHGLAWLMDFSPTRSASLQLTSPFHHTNGTRIFLRGTLSPNSFLSATCFLTLHCAICAALTSVNTHAVSVDVNRQNTSHAASSHV